MRLLTLIACLLCIPQAHASSSQDLCEKHGYATPELPRCRGKACPQLLQTPPSQFRNLSLTAACNYQIQDIQGEPAEVGAFFFTGKQMITGVLRREPSEFINEFTLRGEKKTPWPAKRPIFFRHELYLQFPDVRETEKKFRAPKPSPQAPCWEARVKLKITEMESIFGWDNTEGDYPLKYEVLEMGPYHKCLNPTPAPFGQ